MAYNAGLNPGAFQMDKNDLLNVEPLSTVLQAFADARNWQQYHTPRNLMLALVGEVGELAEIFQWMTDEQVRQIQHDPDRFQHTKEEIADVLLYLVRLANVLEIDLNQAVADKLVKNAVKYPAEKAINLSEKR